MSVVDAPLTRRQLREAERAREAAAAEAARAVAQAQAAALPDVDDDASAGAVRARHAAGPVLTTTPASAPKGAHAATMSTSRHRHAAEPVRYPSRRELRMAAAAGAPAETLPARAEALPAQAETLAEPAEAARPEPVRPEPGPGTRAFVVSPAQPVAPALELQVAPTHEARPTAPTAATRPVTPAGEPTVPVLPPVVAAPVAAAPVPPAPVVAPPVPPAPVPPAPTPSSRRDLRTTEPAQPRETSWMPRAAVLSTMGALTIVAPLSGFGAGPGTAPAQAGIAVEASVLSQLDASAAASSAVTSASLLADPTAASRAIVQSSRSDLRGPLSCDAATSASGVRAALADRSAAVVMPLQSGAYRLTSRYGYRVHPITGTLGQHAGSDFSAPLGTPIHAVAAGTVEYVGAGKDGRSQMLVIVRHELEGKTFYSWYVHMYASGIHVTEGQQVAAGEHIADVGNNGNSTGPHLHLEIHTDAELTTVDPLSWLAAHGATEPVC